MCSPYVTGCSFIQLLPTCFSSCVLLPERDVSQWASREAKTDQCLGQREEKGKHSDLKVGESVILKDRHAGWKFRTPFEPDIWIVQKIAGTIVAARKVGRQVTRNVSWFWRVEPRDGDSGADPLEESGEELEGGYVSQPSSPDECRPVVDGGPSRDLEGSCSPDRGPARGLKQSGISERKYDIHILVYNCDDVAYDPIQSPHPLHLGY
ncbi:hypothetical protein NDU88_009578 [Pleurodeles waltl]|uniref:Uncharacterized protein n=1 Tax=Pleurodeles waltl TaxID=8319 RepID=A0AAV7QV06_PLEWA|nr:hypothetical protein NDU88_009578 [Pleurodeles waltl]